VQKDTLSAPHLERESPRRFVFDHENLVRILDTELAPAAGKTGAYA
jgi:hypothetical protein